MAGIKFIVIVGGFLLIILLAIAVGVSKYGKLKGDFESTTAKLTYTERQYRELETGISEAHTKTLGKDIELKKVTGLLLDREKELNQLRKYSGGKEVAVSTVNVPFAVHDTTTVRVEQDTTFIDSDPFIFGKIVGNMAYLTITGELQYINVTNELSDGTRQVIEKGVLVSTRDPKIRIPLKVNSTFLFSSEPPPRKFSLNPSLTLAITGQTETSPFVGLSLFSYGRDREGENVMLTFLTVGTTTDKAQLVLIPVTYNLGKHLPFFHTLNIGPAVINKTPGFYLGTTL